MKTVPFWTDGDIRPAGLPIATLPDQVDVAVIGSGFTGLHAARTLALNGVNVVVLEQETIGWGASSRNGGMLNPGLKEAAPALFRRYGAARGRRLWEWSMSAIDFAELVVAEEAIDCNFVRNGQVVLASKPQHFAAMREEVAWHAQHLGDHVPELVGPADLRYEIGSAGYYGGLRDARAAGVQPARYVYGLAVAAARAGAQLVEYAGVRSLRRKQDHFELTTAQGVTIAREVLLATNGYTTNLVMSARRGIFTGGSYIITTEPLPPELQRAVSPRNRMFYDSKHFLNYFRLTPDGRMLFGGRHNLSADLPLEQSAVELKRRMVEVFPQLAGIPVSHSWTGRLGLTFDLMPHAGRLTEGPASGVFFAYGYGGHGVAVAGYLGHQMGRLLAGQAADIPFAELPFRRYFFTPYEQFYLPFVSAWYRFLDVVS